MSTRTLEAVRKEIEECRCAMRQAAAPFENRLRELEKQESELLARQRGPLHKCGHCHATIYRDGRFWRGLHSGNACCIDKQYHTPDNGRRVGLERLQEAHLDASAATAQGEANGQDD